jgi:hypothetical protein
MGIYPCEEREWGRNAPRKSSWGSPRGIFCRGDGYGEPKPDGDFPVAIPTHESHLEHTPHALGFSWSSESLRIITLGDRHQLDGSVAIAVR